MTASSKTFGLTVAFLLAGVGSSLAQPTTPAPVPPLTFDPALPSDPVAYVAGAPISGAMLLESLLRQNLSTVVSAIVSNKVLEIELGLAQMEITDEELAAEFKSRLEKMAPGKTEADLAASISLDHLRRQARTELGWKKLFWKANNIPEDQRHQETHQLLMQFFVRQKMADYEQRLRGQEPSPPPGSVAQIIHLPTKAEVVVGASEALDLLMGLVKQGALIEALDEVVKSQVVDQALSKASKSVDENEVEAFATAESAKYQAPFTWPVVLRMKGTTVDREKERYRRVLAWKRCTGKEPSQAQLDEFLSGHKPFFLGATKRVSHVLVRTQDDVSGLPYDAERQRAAKQRADEIYTKAMEGVEFTYLAENYSDDSVTAKGQGRLAQPIKQWGGGLDAEFQRAAWALVEVGEICPPVKSQFGWHVIKLDENKPAGAAEPDWASERYQTWIREEYETREMEAWEKDLRAQTEVRVVPTDEILRLKTRTYLAR